MRRCLPLLALVAAGAAAASPLSEARTAELERLLIQDCGSCHGLRMTGGLGPPITVERMRERDLDWLRQVIAEGLPGSAMPPWRGPLSEPDIDWLARRLQRGPGGED